LMFMLKANKLKSILKLTVEVQGLMWRGQRHDSDRWVERVSVACARLIRVVCALQTDGFHTHIPNRTDTRMC
jgi:hypothetical protein